MTYHPKVIIEKNPDGYVAYPLGFKGIIVGEDDAESSSAQRFDTPYPPDAGGDIPRGTDKRLGTGLSGPPLTGGVMFQRGQFEAA